VSPGGPPSERVILTARRDSVTRTRTLDPGYAAVEAERLRAEGWMVTIGPRKNRETERVRKQRAQIIAAHRSARRARQGEDDAARASEAELQRDPD
jgi:hypothetical protein